MVPWLFEGLAVKISPPPFTLYWRQLILLPFPLKTMWYLQKILRPPSPSDRSLKLPFILQKRIEEHCSSTSPVGCHVAAGVFHPLEWSPCVFVHHTQLDPGTHGSTAPQLPILIKFASFVFLLILIGFGVLYLPWLLGWPGIFQLYLCSFGVSLMQNIVFYCIPCGDPLNWWLMR